MFPNRAALWTALLLLPLPVAAAPAAGLVSLTGAGSFSHQSLGVDFSNETLGLTTVESAFEVGFFVSPAAEIVLGAGFTYIDFEGATEGAIPLSLGARVGASTDSPVWPYVGVAVGVVPYVGDNTGDELGLLLPAVEAGMRYFTSPRASFNAALVFQRLDHWLGVEEVTSSAFGVSLGFSIYLGAGEDTAP